MHTIQPVEAVAKVLEQIRQEQIVVVLRANSTDDARWGAELLIECGFRAIEITWTVPQAEWVIQSLSESFPEVLIGAGTILNPVNGMKALAAGAQFLVSPVLDDAMVQWGTEHQVLTIPGVLTPTELHRAFTLGASVAKLFPAKQAGGPSYLEALMAPLPKVPVIPTGGIGLDDFTQYLAAGAWAVGVGGYLIPVTVMGERNAQEVRRRAKQYLQKLDDFRKKQAAQ